MRKESRSSFRSPPFRRTLRVLGNQDADTGAVDVIQFSQIGNDPKLAASDEIVHALPQQHVPIIENETPAQREKSHRADAPFLDRHHW